MMLLPGQQDLDTAFYLKWIEALTFNGVFWMLDKFFFSKRVTFTGRVFLWK